jgi:hypothetical protein
MLSGALLKLGSGTTLTSSNVTGSNFPSNFTSAISLASTSTVEYNSLTSVNQIIYNGATYGNLTLTNGTGSGTTTKTAGGALTIAGSLYINSNSTFTAGTALSHNVAGNWVNNGTFTQETSTVIFNGAVSAQTISGTENTTFNNLTVDNTAGLTVSKGFTVNNELKFTNGNITAASSSEAVTFETTGFVSTTTGSIPTDTKCIDGYCKKNTNSTTKFTFPVGSSTVYRPASITPSSSNLTTWTANYVNQGPTNFNVTGANIDHVSRLEYWNIDRAGASPSPRLHC